MDEKTDHEVLMELSNDVKWIKEIVSKHLVEHQKLLLAGVGIGGTLVVGLLLALL